jgi:hypothetical protein
MKHIAFGLAIVAMGGAVLAMPRVAQDPHYHQFADRRTLAGVPNMLNVVSNLPFLVAGVLGLNSVAAGRSRERWKQPYVALFAAAALTTAGSAYYHLAPTDARLVWDRLPMSLGFAALTTAVIADRVSMRAARILFAPLVVSSAATVAYWRWSELAGRGDLRPYVLVQFGSLAAILVILVLYRSPKHDTPYLLAGLGAYGIAKALEFFDNAIFSAGHLVSGHTLKHVAAAIGIGCIALMLHQPEES